MAKELWKRWIKHIDIFCFTREVRQDQLGWWSLAVWWKPKKKVTVRNIGVIHSFKWMCGKWRNSRSGRPLPYSSISKAWVFRKGDVRERKRWPQPPLKLSMGQEKASLPTFGGGNLTGSYLEAWICVRDLTPHNIDSIMIGFGSKEEVDRIMVCRRRHHYWSRGLFLVFPKKNPHRQGRLCSEGCCGPVLPAAPIKPFSQKWRRSSGWYEIARFVYRKLLRAV